MYRHESVWHILLVRRGSEPFKNAWALPGGFVNVDERTYDAAKRELAEETGLEVRGLGFFGVYDRLDRDPRGRVISFIYHLMLTYQSIPEVKGGDDAVEAKFWPVTNLPTLAFDHRSIIRDILTSEANRRLDLAYYGN